MAHGRPVNLQAKEREDSQGGGGGEITALSCHCKLAAWRRATQQRADLFIPTLPARFLPSLRQRECGNSIHSPPVSPRSRLSQGASAIRGHQLMMAPSRKFQQWSK